MSDLLLDDIGLSLLRDLHEALTDCRVTRQVYDYENQRGGLIVAHLTERNQRSVVYERILEEYIAHLAFIRDTPDYAYRLTHRLQHLGALSNHDVMALMEQFKYLPDPADMHWIGNLSLEFYDWWMKTGDAS